MDPQVAESSTPSADGQKPVHSLASKRQPWLTNLKAKLKGSKPYKYSPLASDCMFRVSTLLPGKEGDKICCNLVNTLLHPAENYVALSYSWGDPRATRVPIVCDGKDIDITPSLAGALRMLRHPTQWRCMWADGLCINQDDDVEKGRQVVVMDKVYEYASEVVVWLGPDPENIASDCFDLIQDTNKYLDALMLLPDGNFEVSAPIDRQRLNSDPSRWAKVIKLTSLSWFQRVWVVQEAALAKRCVLVWGRQQMDFAELCELALLLSVRTDLHIHGNTGALADVFLFAHCTYQNLTTWRTTLPLVEYHQEQMGYFGCSFLHVLDVGRKLQATHGVDRVYAFLGNPLARRSEEDGDPNETIVKPDYSKHELQVYCETAAALIRDPRNAPFVFGFVSHTEEIDIDGRHLPSWVPRWDKPRAGYTLSPSNYWYRAGGEDMRFEAAVQRDASLATRGILIDRIVWTSPVLTIGNLAIDPSGWDETYQLNKAPFIDELWETLVKVSCGLSDSSADVHAKENLRNTFALVLTRSHPEAVTRAHQERLDETSAELSAYCAAMFCVANGSPVPAESEYSAWHYLHEIKYTDEKRLCWTEQGRLGLVPRFTQPGDECWVFFGVRTPMVLRQRADQKRNLVGEAFVHGTMRGELVDQFLEGTVGDQGVVIA